MLRAIFVGGCCAVIGFILIHALMEWGDEHLIAGQLRYGPIPNLICSLYVATALGVGAGLATYEKRNR